MNKLITKKTKNLLNNIRSYSRSKKLPYKHNLAISPVYPSLLNSSVKFLTSCPPELSKSSTDGFSAGLVDDCDLFKWAITVMGPPDTF